MPDTYGAITYPAGALWPYRLIGGIFQKLINAHPGDFFLDTDTSVTEIVPPMGENSLYSVATTRGNISARHVVHATNAHAAHLVPGLKGRIVSVRGHMSAQTPGASLPDFSNRSWSFIYTNGFDYLTQLPREPLAAVGNSRGGEIMLGGGVAQAVGKGVEDIGVATDGLPFNFHTKVHLAGVLRAVFAEEHWGSEDGKAIKSMWTGNLGFTNDNLPFVGKLPRNLTERDVSNADGAEWIAAGYNGEGMIHAWRSGIAVAQMILEEMVPGKKFGWEQWLPEQLLITEERVITSAFQSPIPNTLE